MLNILSHKTIEVNINTHVYNQELKTNCEAPLLRNIKKGVSERGAG